MGIDVNVRKGPGKEYPISFFVASQRHAVKINASPWRLARGGGLARKQGLGVARFAMSDEKTLDC